MKLTKIRIFYIIIALGAIVGRCTSEPFNIEPYVTTPDTLKIESPVGLKLESHIVQNEVSINVKTTETSTYRIKIKDIAGKTVSQEKLTAKAGDNVLKMYTKSLEKSSYTVELSTEKGTVLGHQLFSNQ